MLVNLTPHPVTIYDGGGDQVITTIPPDGHSLRLEEVVTPGRGDLLEDDVPGGIPVVHVALGGVDQMPPVVEGTTYIVSMPLLMGLAALGIDRPDMVYPYGQVRDGQGRIIGCRSLARILADRVRPTTQDLQLLDGDGNYIGEHLG